MDSDSEEAHDNIEKADLTEMLRERMRRVEGDYYPKSLKTWSLECIKSHTDLFLQIEQSTGLNPFDQLPNSLKTEVLGDEIEWKWSRREQLLMNRQVTNLHVSWGDPETYSESTKSFCSSLMAAMPKLVEFEWTGSISTIINKSVMPMDIITSTPHFASLQVFTLTYFTCSDLQLQMIASHLKELRVLKLELDESVSSKGISALATLKHLEEFPFNPSIGRRDNEPQWANKMYNMCLQYMPKLQVVGDEEFDLELDILMDDTEEYYHIDFQSIQTPTELGLRQMVLKSNGQLIIPEGITFPNLTSLILAFPLENFRLDAHRLSKVTELGLFELGMDHYLRILKIMGHQIQVLTILEQDDLVLDLILRLCPNLKKFLIGMSPERLTCSSPLEPETDLQNLKELRVNLDGNSAAIPGFAQGVLVQLLRAPNLRLIKLSNVYLTEKDVEVITRLVRKGQMLQKLEQLFVKNVTKEHLDCYKDLVVNNMARFCPRLVRFYDDNRW